ncbi:MAG: DUF4230 domain-containing protein [Anaerolineae bacterium]|nr:DUF4230 domain-containing protein [Anaerolineae bacterium]
MQPPNPEQNQPPTLPEFEQPHDNQTGIVTVSPTPVSDPPTPEGRNRGCLWGLTGALGCLLVLLIPVAVAVLLGLTSVNGVLGALESIFRPDSAPAVARVESTQTILNSIQPLGQLVSISAQLAKADIQVSVQQGALNSCSFSANHVAQGTIEAGIDLTRVDESAISYDEATNTYTIVLPPPQLTSCRIDFIRQYNRSFTACAVDWDEARLLANYISLTDFRDEAIEGGILTRAQQETRQVVGNFVQLLTEANVEIVFADANESTLPNSCMPDIPPRWALNEQTGEWVKN